MTEEHEKFFVYHGVSDWRWQFVFFTDNALSGEEAINQAWAESIEMGQIPEGDYMAVPQSATTIRKVSDD